MSESRFLNPKFPALWHGGDYNADQWPSEVWAEDARLMREARFHVATIGIFSWARLEPAPGQYEFDWLDEVIARLTDENRWFILSTPSAAPPAWMGKRFPETLRTGEDRVQRLHGNRVNYNLASPFYRDKCRAMARQLAARYAHHPRLLAWHLSNEYNGADYGPDSVTAFRRWLRHKYDRDISNLNRAYWTAFWSHTYQSWDEIDPPGGPHGEVSIQGLTVDWMRFVTDQTIEFMENEAIPLRAANGAIPITTNLMGTYPGLDYRKFAEHLDFISWDSYPGNQDPLTTPGPWIATAFKHDLMRSLKPDKPWLLMECSPSSGNWFAHMSLKRPGMHRFEAMQALAHGADGVQYFQWRQSRGGQEQFHGAVVGHNGTTETRVFTDVQNVGLELESLRALTGSLVEARVAVIFDWEAMWAIDAASGPVRGNKGYEKTCIEHYRAFWQAGISVDIVGLDDSLERYDLVVAPMAYSLRPGFGERLEAFVQRGGTFVTTYLSGWVDESSLVYEGGFLAPLKKVLGIRSEELDVLVPGQTNRVEMAENELGLVGSFEVADFCELIHCDNAKVIGTYGQEFYAGRPALTVNQFGKGLAYYVASRNESAFNDAFLRALARQAGINPVTDATLPNGVTAQARTNGKTEFVFMLNANSHPVSVPLANGSQIDLAPWGATITPPVVAEGSR